jgi:hypothetical protein
MVHISRAVQRIQNEKSRQDFQDEQNKKALFEEYNSTTDKNKKVELLREAQSEGWL